MTSTLEMTGLESLFIIPRGRKVESLCLPRSLCVSAPLRETLFAFNLLALIMLVPLSTGFGAQAEDTSARPACSLFLRPTTPGWRRATG